MFLKCCSNKEEYKELVSKGSKRNPNTGELKPKYRFKLPKGYTFRFGKWKEFRVSEVPMSYIRWFEANVPKEQW